MSHPKAKIAEFRFGRAPVSKALKPTLWVLLAVICGVAPVRAQLVVFTREQVMKYTAGNPYERFPDGRSEVPRLVLEKMRTCRPKTFIAC